ncbi:NUDIX domain-containing protein [Saccharopolyspora cebuensis]
MARYDARGNVVGAVRRDRMRREGLWHAAASVLVLSPDGASVYVHRRTATKDVYPGRYDCWTGGVVAAGEDPGTAAVRELAEELGVRGVAPQPLFRLAFEEGSVRYHAFCYRTSWDGPVRHQPEEIAEGGWMGLAELRERLADPAWPFVPDGRRLVEEWFARGG